MLAPSCTPSPDRGDSSRALASTRRASAWQKQVHHLYAGLLGYPTHRSSTGVPVAHCSQRGPPRSSCAFFSTSSTAKHTLHEPMHPSALPTDTLLRDCDETRTRRSGPGGQHRNKVETAVVLLHRPTMLLAQASERRSQSQNRGVALKRLRLRLAIEYRTQPEANGPSPLWLARTRGRQIVVAKDHDDYSALIAEALDHLQTSRWEMATVAASLGVSTSQLIKLFRKVPAVWAGVNRLRTDAASHPTPPE